MKIFYTGDIKLEATKLLRGADLPKRTDVLVMDSTYSQTEHPSRVNEEKNVLEAVEEALSKNEPVILPVFAVGRSQEALLILEKYADKIALDGMARDATQMVMSYGRYIRDPRTLQRILNKVTWIRTEQERAKALDRFPIIVTTAGMASGGPIIYYLRQLQRRPEAKILFIGYLTEDSPARSLLETGILRTAEEEIKVRCDIRHFDLSAHAGRSELFEIVRRVKPSLAVCVHGEPKFCERFAEEIEEDLGIKAVAPANGEVVEM
jgi:putative mRNA 3-end processing factor